jgi:serine kinase of HPr protein (carbohydrate metabolism regulator)
MSLPSLYQLTGTYLQLMHKMADQDLDAQTIQDTIESTGLMDDISTKGIGYVMVARTFASHILPIKDEIKRLQALAKHYDSAESRLYDALLLNMQTAQIERIEGPLMTISIRNNTEKTDIFDAAQIPAQFMRQPATPHAEPDKEAIKSAIKKGEEVPGCRLTRSQKLHIA